MIQAERSCECGLKARPKVYLAKISMLLNIRDEKHKKSAELWDYLDRLMAKNVGIIERPKGSSHPYYPEMMYPVDYGYLDGTTTVDEGGIDVWSGSLKPPLLKVIICTVYLMKRDAELKILLGCNCDETEAIMVFLNNHTMRGILIRRPHS
jgi:inorganic pyrophosphatase